MNKCPKCGTEFEGTFCPECGTKWLEKKTCPSCGRSLPGSAKFCTYCGKSFYAPPRPAPKPKKKRSFKRWVSEHKKLFGFLIAALVLALILSIVIPIVIIHRHDGTYYLYSNEQYDYETYYILKGHSYTDEDGYTGDVEFDGNQIRLYAELFGMRDVAAEGTIDGDVIKLKIMGAEVIYAKKGAMHEHEFGDWRVQTPSTCVEYGTEIRSCKGCGKTETRSILTLAPHKGDWNITKEATCTETGTREKHCTVCQQDIVETIDMIAHRADSWKTDDSAHWQICTMCKEEFNRGEHSANHDVWEFGQETHWHPCTVCSHRCEETAHTYSNKDWCDICGMEKGTYGLEFVLQDGGYAVTGIGECTASEIVIPNVHGKDHLPVIAIDESAFKSCDELTSVTIPDSVTSIGSYAFAGCSGLTEITIGSSVTAIGESAFRSCDELTSVTIPDSVTSIGTRAFAECGRLTSVSIGSGLTSIGEYAFAWCEGLPEITIPDSVTAIGSSAFSGCDGLTSVTIGSGVTAIGDWAFASCSGLTEITIGSGVTAIGSSAFYGCSGLTKINVEENNPSYHAEGNCLIETKSKSLIAGCKTSVIPNDGSVTSIGEYAFYKCNGLTSITIPSSVTSIGYGAFGECSGLTSIKFNGTTDEWKAIKKDSYWKYSSSIREVICTNGTLTGSDIG